MIYTLEFRAMGCRMLAAVDRNADSPGSPDDGSNLLEQVPAWFDAWEQVLSRFRPYSELNRLNLSAGKPFLASKVLWSVYQAALEAETASDGLVTPTLLNALEQAGYKHSFEVDPQAEVDLPGAEPGERGDGQDPSRMLGWIGSSVPQDGKRVIQLPRGARLDFGGVAKGWAAQQAVLRLQETGPALVDAGGDIAISGACLDGQKWLVGIEDPFHPEEDLTILQLGRCGVATSGRNYRRWRQDGNWMHHIIDPRTGHPAETDVLTATVIAPDVLQAEVAAKTVFILGSRSGMDWLEDRPDLSGLLVLEDGSYLRTHSMDNVIYTQEGR